MSHPELLSTPQLSEASVPQSFAFPVSHSFDLGGSATGVSAVFVCLSFFFALLFLSDSLYITRNAFQFFNDRQLWQAKIYKIRCSATPSRHAYAMLLQFKT